MSRNKPSKAEQDYQAYLERSAKLDARIAAGESITEIMRAEQLARGIEAINRIVARDQEDEES